MTDAGTVPPPAERGHGFGTGPVFLASLSTILGAILFLRFGYAVGNLGLLGALGVILLGHAVTVPTALALAEIATNRRVEGGGEYFIVSRSFGPSIGGAIGISLYLSQAVSVGFYLIAFAESFRPLIPWLASLGFGFDPRLVSVPATIGLSVLVVLRGADLGVKALYVVAAVLGVSLLLFFLGPAEGATLGDPGGLLAHVDDPDPFILVFAICFPAFTGMTAGVGLSGDLANPRRSIPLGILGATGAGMAIYVAVVWKMASSAAPDVLVGDLAMQHIALWGPIIPVGLACATLSSAVGSILVAPRTLQAIAQDDLLPVRRLNALLARGVGRENEPRSATVVTAVVALGVALLGSVDLVARVISMFFMVTYGALCAISFLEHFAARPSYRPSFRSKWYLSLAGALVSVLLMFQMDPLYAVVAIVLMAALYGLISRAAPGRDDLGSIFGGVMAQASRYLHIRMQSGAAAEDWRPSVITITPRTFDRSSPLRLLTWLCYRFGFGTYLHYIPGRLDRRTFEEAAQVKGRLLELAGERYGEIFVDTIISPSMASALAQSLQIPGVSGIENNTILFEFSIHDPTSVLEELQGGLTLAAVPHMNRLVLRHGENFFGNRRTIHVWLTWHDYRNANLMVLLAYILLGHPEWQKGEIRVYAAFPEHQAPERTTELTRMIQEGRLQISPKNVQVIATDDRVDFSRLVRNHSADADLVILGFTESRRREKGSELFRRHEDLRDILWVSAARPIEIE
ncbi:MAG: amino acid permease [Gemmatimonadota bacterium]